MTHLLSYTLYAYVIGVYLSNGLNCLPCWLYLTYYPNGSNCLNSLSVCWSDCSDAERKTRA